MSAEHYYAERLREQAYKTLLPQVRDLEEELRNVNASLASGIRQIERRLEALRQIEIPTTELILDEFLGEIDRRKDLKMGSLALFARDVCQKETQEEILTFLLDSAQAFSPRLALFAVRGEKLVGWSSRGCSDDAARNINSNSFARSECLQLWAALENGSPVTASELPDGAAWQSLREGSQCPWLFFPLCVMQKPVALLLAGEADEVAADRFAIAILTEFVSLRLENIALRILYELTSTRPESAVQQAVEGKAPVDESAAPAFSAETPAMQPELAREQTAELITAVPNPFHEAKPAPSIEMNGERADAWIDTETQIPLPTDSAPLEPQPLPEEEKLHIEAKRCARLLVSEIKHYNECHVVEGRQNKNLYLRLKNDIDRHREMYEKRIPKSVLQRVDYFHDEIIRILGDNDPSTLGSDYPGPRVES
jgi:hypothetical protein